MMIKEMWNNGRQLRCIHKGEFGTVGYDENTYNYNADGLRTKKTRMYYDTATGDIGYQATEYTLHGKNIVHMVQGGNSLHFWYDAQNRPAIVDFNGTKYAYILNLQGDVVGIRNSVGVEVVRYTYDAWGKLLETTGSLASTLGYMNPFRYRGYVYDEETGFYYLRSRYYNPKWDRFVNADSIVGSNQFTYCKSNPICKKDTNGNIGIGIFGPDGDEEEILFPELYEAQLRQQAVVQSNNREVRKTIKDYSFGIHAGLYPENRHVTVLALFSNFDSFISKKTNFRGENDSGCAMFIRAGILNKTGRHGDLIYHAGASSMFNEGDLIISGKIKDIGSPSELVKGMILGTKMDGTYNDGINAALFWRRNAGVKWRRAGIIWQRSRKEASKQPRYFVKGAEVV